MGLDNGVSLKILDVNSFKTIPSWVHKLALSDEYDILYWRKCWNIRRAILRYLGEKSGECYYDLTLEDLHNIINIVKKLCTRKNWDETDSIWTYDEIKRNYKYNLRMARKTLRWLKKKPENSYSLYFYDSY